MMMMMMIMMMQINDDKCWREFKEMIDKGVYDRGCI